MADPEFFIDQSNHKYKHKNLTSAVAGHRGAGDLEQRLAGGLPLSLVANGGVLIPTT
jgi:hypothetical protein